MKDRRKARYAIFASAVVALGAVIAVVQKERQVNSFILHIGLSDEWDEFKKTGKNWA